MNIIMKPYSHYIRVSKYISPNRGIEEFKSEEIPEGYMIVETQYIPSSTYQAILINTEPVLVDTSSFNKGGKVISEMINKQSSMYDLNEEQIMDLYNSISYEKDKERKLIKE